MKYEPITDGELWIHGVKVNNIFCQVVLKVNLQTITETAARVNLTLQYINDQLFFELTPSEESVALVGLPV